MQEQNIIGQLCIKDFLKNYWLKRPLLIKNAIKNIESYASKEDFLDMATDEDFETRIVYEKGGQYPWQVKHGPLGADDFKKDALWTLMCHNLNLYAPEFYNLQKMVDFIPDWQFDDIMATISKKDASVGAHIDNYSVFIVQAQGKRKWSLQTNPDKTWMENTDIKLLKNFNPEFEWILEPGDAIYIPPHCAHHGVTLEDSVSYSIGFKSLEYNKVVDFWATQVYSELSDDDFYKDPKLSHREDKYEILDEEFDIIFNEVSKKMGKESLKLALARLLSRPRRPIEPAELISKEEIVTALQDGMVLRKDLHTKFNFFKGNNQIQLFINGHHFEVNENDFKTIKKILDVASFDSLQIDNKLSEEVLEIIQTLIERGDLYLEYED